MNYVKMVLLLEDKDDNKLRGNINEQRENIYFLIPPLRDGAQTQGVDFSIDDKLKDNANASRRLWVLIILKVAGLDANPTGYRIFSKN